MGTEKKILLEAEDIQRLISRMAHEIVEKNGGVDDLALIGIQSRGVHLVHRLARKIETLKGFVPSTGAIDVTAFRDDRERAREPGVPAVTISVDDKTVVLVDDVIYTGRTVRAALDLVSQLGKPKKILVAILVDRGDRELPIKADIVGKNVQAESFERVNVLLQESDGADQVTVTRSRQRGGPFGKPPA